MPSIHRESAPSNDDETASAHEGLLLRDRIVEQLRNEPLPVVEIAKRLDEDWKLVLRELDSLVLAGEVDEVNSLSKLTQYHLTKIEDRSASDEAAKVRTEHPGAEEPGEDSTHPQPSDEKLRDALVRILSSSPGGLTKHELASALPDPEATRSEINSVLYRFADTFRSDKATPPRWSCIVPTVDSRSNSAGVSVLVENSDSEGDVAGAVRSPGRTPDMGQQPELSALGQSILAVLRNEELPVITIAERLRVHMDRVRGELEDLVTCGRVEEFREGKGLPRFRIHETTRAANLLASSDDSRPDDQQGWVTMSSESLTLLGSSLGSRILELLSTGPVSLADLEYRLGEDRDRIEAVAGELIAQGRVLKLPERGPCVYGLLGGEVLQSETQIPPEAAKDENPTEHDDSIAKVLVSEASIRALSQERARTITGLDAETVAIFFSRLEAEGRLRRVVDRSGLTWVRVDS